MLTNKRAKQLLREAKDKIEKEKEKNKSKKNLRRVA